MVRHGPLWTMLLLVLLVAVLLLLPPLQPLTLVARCSVV